MAGEKKTMKLTQKIAAAILLLLLGIAAYALFRTSRPAGGVSEIAKQSVAAQGPLVDQTPLLTAERLVQMPNPPEELPFAQEALRLADQEMDLAFAAAVREAEDHPPVLTAEAKAIQA